MSSPTPARAQYIPIYVDPPATPHHWQGVSPFSMGAYHYWEGGYVLSNDSEWQSGSAPDGNVDVRFGNYSGGLHRQYVLFEDSDNDLKLRSLWFEAGTWYQLGEHEDLTLGFGATETNPYLLVVNSQDWNKQSEHTFLLGVLKIDAITGIGRIENYAEGGLGIFNADWFDLNDQHIQIGGMGATHFMDKLSGGGTIDVGLFGGVEAEQVQPHLILQGDNRDWGGALRVNQRGFAIIKTNQALGYGSEKRVYDGGSLALRSHVGNPLLHFAPVNAPTQRLTITGAGIIRREGTERIGALYSDGGLNLFGMGVEFSGDTLFGARGDRGGGLYLSGGVYNSTDNGRFIKVGPGIVFLAPNAFGSGGSVSNSWTGDTVIRGGVLAPDDGGLPGSVDSGGSFTGTSNLVLDGGILGLGNDFVRDLGTGGNEIRWTGSGGFDAFGSNSSVTLDGGATLAWGSTPHFIGDGDALLLSSRYAFADITFTNAINLGSQTREVRVERGEGNAHAILSGNLSGAGGGLLKTGRGLLHLSGANTYTGATVIADGALSGPRSSSSNIQLAGGVLEVKEGIYTLGTGGGQIQWTGSGGLAAYGGDHSIDFDNVNFWEPLIWGGTAHFVAADDELRFGHYTATGTVVFYNLIDLGSGGRRTVRVERGSDLSRADVVLAESINGTADLWFVGNGRIDLQGRSNGRDANWDESASTKVYIYGVELRLNNLGQLNEYGDLLIGHGGTLTLDDITPWGSTWHYDRIKDDGLITLAAGSIVYNRGTNWGDPVTPEKVGTLTIKSGQNSVMLFADQAGDGQLPELRAVALLHDNSPDDSRGTLHFSEKESRLRLDTSASGNNVSLYNGVSIIPWATAATSGGFTGFAQAVTESGIHYVKALENYHLGDADTWGSDTATDDALNVRMTSGQSLTDNRFVHSLIMDGGNLNLSSGAELNIVSGGLIAGGTGGTRAIQGSGKITTDSAALYLHTFRNMLISGNVQFDSGASDLVKSQPGTLVFNSSTTHHFRNIYIHRGTVNLRSGIVALAADGGRITVGDGGGNATLALAPKRWDQIVKTGGGLPSITLNGTPYDPRGPEYGGAQAILQMGGNTKLHLEELHIENRGTIDWVGGEVGLANILWIETLTFSGPDAILFMRNWYEYEDILLVRKTNFSEGYLSQIVFEGYQNYDTTYRQWDNDYWQITPFNKLPLSYADEPEPETYGAILATLGVGVYLWRKRKKAKQALGLPLRVGRRRVAPSI